MKKSNRMSRWDSARLYIEDEIKVQTFVLYGDITGEKHADGSPVRRDWAQEYKGQA